MCDADRQRHESRESGTECGFTKRLRYLARRLPDITVARSILSFMDPRAQTMHAVSFKPYLYFHEEDSNRHQENKKPLKWLRVWSRHCLQQEGREGYWVSAVRRIWSLRGRNTRPERLGFGERRDSRCHIGSRNISTCLCILYPQQSILGKRIAYVHKSFFRNNVKKKNKSKGCSGEDMRSV
jgi:hypothetical protein